MLEKSGTIVLTQQDLDEFHLGRVTDRVESNWGLTYNQLMEIVTTNSYVLQSAVN